MITNRAYAAGQAARATLAVAGEEPVAKAWTILVYLAADNNLGAPAQASLHDLDAFQALEQAAFLNPAPASMRRRWTCCTWRRA